MQIVGERVGQAQAHGVGDVAGMDPRLEGPGGELVGHGHPDATDLDGPAGEVRLGTQPRRDRVDTVPPQRAGILRWSGAGVGDQRLAVGDDVLTRIHRRVRGNPDRGGEQAVGGCDMGDQVADGPATHRARRSPGRAVEFGERGLEQTNRRRERRGKGGYRRRRPAPRQRRGHDLGGRRWRPGTGVRGIGVGGIGVRGVGVRGVGICPADERGERHRGPAQCRRLLRTRRAAVDMRRHRHGLLGVAGVQRPCPEKVGHVPAACVHLPAPSREPTSTVTWRAEGDAIVVLAHRRRPKSPGHQR